MSFKNFYIFKLYIFLTDILINIIKKSYLTRIISKILLGNYTNLSGKHFIKLNMNLIINEKNLFNKN